MTDEPEVLEAEPVPQVTPPQGAPTRSPGDTRKAWMLAMAADFVQWVLFPIFAAGMTPWNVGVDLIVAFLITRWMGWHLAFLPAFVTELVPVANIVPSWTLAMWIVTKLRRGRS